VSQCLSKTEPKVKAHFPSALIKHFVVNSLKDSKHSRVTKASGPFDAEATRRPREASGGQKVEAKRKICHPAGNQTSDTNNEANH